MAEMLVASWLSCCKPHIPGRVNPTFKPKPRYRQPGQQQWHISNYPKTKCPSFVCNRHSGSFSAHGITSGRLEGFRTALCSHLTAQNCLKELRCLVVKRPWGMKFYINLYSSGNTPRFQPADLCTCSMYSTDFLLFFSFFLVTDRSPDIKAGHSWISSASSLTTCPWIPVWRGTLSRWENNPSVQQTLPYGHKGRSAFFWKWKQLLSSKRHNQ